MRTVTVTRTLPVKLDSFEIDELATRMAQAWREAREKEDELKEHKNKVKAEIGELYAEHDHLAAVVRERQEDREVECLDQYDYVLGMIITVRKDTGEKVDERRMSEEERQTNLLEEDAQGGPADEAERVEQVENHKGPTPDPVNG